MGRFMHFQTLAPILGELSVTCAGRVQSVRETRSSSAPVWPIRVWRTRPIPVSRPRVSSLRHPRRHLVAYGSTNKCRPVNRSKASGNTAKRPTQLAYLPLTTATRLTMPATVKRIDSQRWVCRTHLFQFKSRLLSPVGHFNAELRCVLGVQSLPAVELPCLNTNNAARTPSESGIVTGNALSRTRSKSAQLSGGPNQVDKRNTPYPPPGTCYKFSANHSDSVRIQLLDLDRQSRVTHALVDFGPSG